MNLLDLKCFRHSLVSVDDMSVVYGMLMWLSDLLFDYSFGQLFQIFGRKHFKILSAYGPMVTKLYSIMVLDGRVT